MKKYYLWSAFILAAVCLVLLVNNRPDRAAKDGLIRIKKDVIEDEPLTAVEADSELPDEAVLEKEIAEDQKEEKYDHIVAIVIDDLGKKFSKSNELTALGLDFTFSILPGENYSMEMSDSLTMNGYEIMLHLPMEPHDYPEDYPGEHALMTEMSDDDIIERTRELLNMIPDASGVNNHMGSKFCEDCEKMSLVMSVVSENDIFFLDSITSSDSCGAKTARTYNVPYTKRDVFLDNDKDEEAILKQVQKLIRISKKYGSAVAICHPYPETIQALQKAKVMLDESGVGVKRLSEVIKVRSLKKNEKQVSLTGITPN